VLHLAAALHELAELQVIQSCSGIAVAMVKLLLCRTTLRIA
jgi:hypothetical protein